LDPTGDARQKMMDQFVVTALAVSSPLKGATTNNFHLTNSVVLEIDASLEETGYKRPVSYRDSYSPTQAGRVWRDGGYARSS
jgi:hypothetical protein